ncbi:hypothetical protein HNQ41_003326 [Texcoconibacillus texcoconensis]|uniref:Uncharacterized protein n=1 Tax=Texcoconibacillus texcoconensis TaxID=1095777 RepID=A0A840QSC9_9BACI|nr:hypothetical protein [Texcoconibacillus texcoconensis]MBB5175096.1 hypothetical protein [Texcoconibacillus texcoconensis]
MKLSYYGELLFDRKVFIFIEQKLSTLV